MRPQAVLFDYNGTISLDEELAEETWGRAFRSLGLPWSRELFFNRIMGHPGSQMALLGVKLLTGEDDPALAERVRERERQLIVTIRELGSTISEDTAAVVRRVAREAKTAVVTSCNRRLVSEELALAGLLSEVDVLVAAEDVSRHKPHPEPYLRALAELGVSAGQAVAVEDSQPGIASARAAGLRVISVGELYESGLELLAVRSLTEPAFIELLGLEAARVG